MFNRKILAFIKVWKDKKLRKLLVLRGARQVGKTYGFGCPDGALYFETWKEKVLILMEAKVESYGCEGQVKPQPLMQHSTLMC